MSLKCSKNLCGLEIPLTRTMVALSFQNWFDELKFIMEIAFLVIFV